MNRFVLDASVSLRWFLDTNVPAYANRIKQLLNGGAQALVPALWQLEMSNGLVVAQRRGALTVEEVDRSLLHVEQLLEQLFESDSAIVSVRQSLPSRDNFVSLLTMPHTSPRLSARIFLWPPWMNV